MSVLQNQVSAHVRLIWLILRVFFGTQWRMAYSFAWWQPWPDIWEQTQHSNSSSAVCVWCAVSCICCWDLLSCPLLSTLMDIWWKYFLVLSFRRSLNCEVSLMCIGLTCVRWLFYNSEFCDLNGEMTCLKCFPMFFRPAHQCELKFRDGSPTKGFPHNYIMGLLTCVNSPSCWGLFPDVTVRGFLTDVCQKSLNIPHTGRPR